MSQASRGLTSADHQTMRLARSVGEILKMQHRISLGIVVFLGLASMSFAQGVAGSGISAGVAGGISAGGLGGGQVGTIGGGGTSGTGLDAVGGAQGGANAAGLGDRQTALQTTGFLNQNTQAGGGGFLGNQNSNTAGAQGGGQFGNAGARGGQQGRGNQRQQQRRTRVIRTRISVPSDFASPVILGTQIQSNLTGQFRRASNFESIARVKLGATRPMTGANITVIPNGRTVVLQGQVATERDRTLAERMARFEPGVDRVVNELTVVSFR